MRLVSMLATKHTTIWYHEWNTTQLINYVCKIKRNALWWQGEPQCAVPTLPDTAFVLLDSRTPDRVHCELSAQFHLNMFCVKHWILSEAGMAWNFKKLVAKRFKNLVTYFIIGHFSQFMNHKICEPGFLAGASLQRQRYELQRARSSHLQAEHNKVTIFPELVQRKQETLIVDDN